MSGAFSPTEDVESRVIELMMGNSEQIQVDLDNLPTDDEEFDYLLNCAQESEALAPEYAKIAQGYWRLGLLKNAKAVVDGGIQSTCWSLKYQLPALWV